MKSRLSILLLCVPIAAALSVPFYNRVAPTLDGWPFFFWWQTGCVLAGALLTGAAYLFDARVARKSDSDKDRSPRDHAA
ncbi:hypothetical protein LMG28614_07135 [Paraburkholderia ultramafica]|uniref:DUF3311 domain-containing protein n=1 Tax=Paraburkholderia ultramafica TaxID=1544867 RepID=A0A6S7BQS7_9BURK|nr:DUF3311 domain-containing protein [Paraburkholderia ultramafica]CAB3809785.1 hypothetical protein LMG28614_07135 [Paraburkholderia ultramafica]